MGASLGGLRKRIRDGFLAVFRAGKRFPAEELEFIPIREKTLEFFTDSPHREKRGNFFTDFPR